MRSYACIDRFEGKFAVCEVELVPLEESVNMDCSEKETMMVDLVPAEIFRAVGTARESDILIVEHDGCDVTDILFKDDEEKQRRVERIAALMSDN